VPNPDATLALPNVTLRAGQKVVTFVARNLEPYRGFHIFMRAVAAICERNPDAHIVIVGGDGVSYGAKLPEGQTHRAIELAKHPVDESRVHFTGRLPYDTFKTLLQVSAAHVYLTYPFVLSWSFLEAMSTGCLMIGSRTAPVEEVIEDGRNGVLVDFFDHAGIADAVTEALSHPERYTAMRAAARRTVRDNYDLTRITLPQQTQLMASLLP
ncbi:MAG TPA: glycosyltransferase, partial [Devosia sp.]|nr:glycosyltransferase [Devosia sp.]